MAFQSSIHSKMMFYCHVFKDLKDDKKFLDNFLSLPGSTLVFLPNFGPFISWQPLGPLLKVKLLVGYM